MFDLPEFYKEFDKGPNLNEENICRCNNNSQFSAGTSIVGAAESTYKKFFSKFPILLKYTDEQT